MFENLLKELVGGSEGIQERADGVAFLNVARSVYPSTTTCYLGLNIPLGAQRQRFVQCTYSDHWVKHCISREKIDVARLGGLALAVRSTLDWSDLGSTPDAERLMVYADGSQAGRQVLSIPLRPLFGETAIFLVASEMPAAAWTEQRKILARDFRVLANYFHQHILRIYGHNADSQILVSARELDCLKWMAAGKTAWEASVILGISERTVRFHLNAAREKLNCLTTTQAVARAVSEQLI